MELAFRLFRNLGIAAALGLFASATATAASTRMLLDVEPANPRAARGDVDEDEDDGPRARNDANDDWSRRKRARDAAVATILGYDPFCPGCVPEPPGEPGGGGGRPPVADTKTPLSVALLATMESSEPTASLATIYDPARGTWVAKVGDELELGAVVTDIGPGRVAYVRGGAVGMLDVSPAAQAKPKTAKKTPKAGGRKPPKPPAESDQIQCTGGSDCTIERDLINEVLANPTKLGGIRAFPSGGGFKIAGVRRGSLPYQLGLRSGDVLTEVNGRTIDSIDAALELLPRLKSARNVSVTLSRRGKPVTHNVAII